MGFAKTFADAGVGAAARFQAANENKEVKGYTFDYKEFADDNNDPNTSLVGGAAAGHPGGRARDRARGLRRHAERLPHPAADPVVRHRLRHDATAPTAATGFGISAYGCLIPTSPKRIPGVQWELLKKQLATKGIQKPTLALLGTDTTSGKQSVQSGASAAEGVGFKVVYAKGAFPGPPAVVGDYSPYAQALLESNDGKAPDVIYTSIAPDRARWG